MRTIVALFVLACTMALASAFASSASATSYGYAGYSSGGACSGCRVVVHNGTTGANGSTITDGNGTFAFNLNSSQQYGFRIDTCKVHSYYSSAWSSYVWGSQSSLPSLYANAFGAC